MNSNRGSVLVGVSVVLLALGGGLIATYQITGSEGVASTTRLSAEEEASADAQVVAGVEAAATAFLDRNVTVRFAERERVLKWRDLGLGVDHDAVVREALRFGKDVPASLYEGAIEKGTVPVVADREKTAEALMKLKETLDVAARNAYLALEEKQVVPAEPGFGIDIYGSVSAVESAARAGSAKVELEGVELAPELTVEDLGIDDISNELASFTTKFSVAEKSRNDNLKLAASKIHGLVLQPGEDFSFNEVVGDRSEKEGYKIAHVITAGEMVDGLAGGACQISTTLHGAAFFAGLEIVNSIPHSRPSTYVHMGLDATVVWPNVDLKLRNPYDFPVAIYYRVARGEAVVKILGKPRPYDKVVFEREVAEEVEFDTITREDAELPVGSMVVEQDGFYGYKLNRVRKMYKDGKLVKQDKWRLNYRPVTEYVRLGINPDPNLPPPKQPKGHGPKPPKAKKFTLAQ